MERILQPMVEIILRNAAGKLEMSEEFLGVSFSALQG